MCDWLWASFFLFASAEVGLAVLSLALLVGGPRTLCSLFAILHCISTLLPLTQGDRLFSPISVLMEGASLHPLDLG